MKFKHDVIGPDFENSDIVVFDFGDAEISLVIPEDPAKSGGYIAAQNQKALPTGPDYRWRTHPFGFRIYDLVQKIWLYRDETSENTVASESFDLYLIEIPDDMREEINPLSKTGFTQWLFKYYRMMSVRGDTSLLGSDIELSNMKAWMMPLSIDDIKSYPADLLDWPILTMKPPYEDDDEANAARDPDYLIYIPLSDRLFLYIDNCISMIYSDCNPITLPIANILELKHDILMEILAHVKVSYSSDVLALIEEKNKGS